MMTINVLLSGKLRLDGFGNGQAMNVDDTVQLALVDRGTISDVTQGMSVPSDRVAMTMLNGRKCQLECNFKRRDGVILIPSDVGDPDPARVVMLTLQSWGRQ